MGRHKISVPKITKEKFELLKPKCNCPCNQLIPWKDHYRLNGIPKYIHGHHSRKKPIPITKEEFDRTIPHYCKCDCNEEILWQESYRWNGIPKYKYGHFMKKYPPMKGKHHTEKTKQILHYINLGKPGTFKGRKHTEKSKKLMSEVRIGRIPWNKGLSTIINQNYNTRDEYIKLYRKTKNEFIREINLHWRQENPGYDTRRKDLEFIPLNNWFRQSESHHVDTKHVIFIPFTLHRSVGHNIFTNRNMEIINTIAFFFLVMQNINKLKKLFS